MLCLHLPQSVLYAMIVFVAVQTTVRHAAELGAATAPAGVKAPPSSCKTPHSGIPFPSPRVNRGGAHASAAAGASPAARLAPPSLALPKGASKENAGGVQLL